MTDRATRGSGPDDLDDLVTALLTASRALVGVSARSLADIEESVTLPQFRTLVVLEAHGPTRLNRLAQRLGVGPSTALRSIDRLVGAGLADRQPNTEDRREVVIALTRRGRALVEDVTQRRRRAIEEIAQSMAPRRRQSVVRALVAFAEAADEPLALGDSAAALGW